MNSSWVSLLVLGFIFMMIFLNWTCLCLTQNGDRPATVNLGALAAYNSTIGRVAKKAIELALEDVNNDKTLLNRTRLVLTMMDSNCSAFIGTSAALELSKKDVMAVIGPQSSVIAHVISHIASALQVPLLSFGATDPSLSSLQYPYFLRLTHSDFSEMTAIAAVIRNFNWKEVIAVYVDDDYGRNGISALGDALVNVADIVHKYRMPPTITRSDLGSNLKDLSLMTTRVFVVHMNPDAGLKLLTEVHQLGMLSSGYVWIATDWLSTALDSLALDLDAIKSLQGVITVRRHIPDSYELHAFSARWNNLQKSGAVDAGLNVFGLYAYDTVWAVAHAIDTFLERRGNISFTNYPQLSAASGSESEVAELKVFDGGPQLRRSLLQTNIMGLTGRIQLDARGDLYGPDFEIINIVGTGFHKVSYWSNISGLSIIPPESRTVSSNNKSSLKKKVNDLIWPGYSNQVPRGWTVPSNGRRFRILIPWKKGEFKKLVEVEGSNVANGYCIEVFTAAVNMLSYPFPHEFVVYGSDESPPIYNELVEQVALKKFDAAVGDITILKNRSKDVDFTQPYVEAGLVVVVPVKKINSNPWAFLKPFTPEMWLTTAAFFLVIGAVVWILEHKLNSEFRGEPQKQIVTIFWFSFSTMFFVHREQIVSSLARMVLLIWLFVVLIINSSYTASLTSIFTVQQLTPTIKGIDDLISSNLPIGYLTGSFVRNYLSGELNIAQSRLIPLDSPEKYAKALSDGIHNGGVGAIVDEFPAIELFLSNRCGFGIAGQPFTKGGWGFAFQKGSPLQLDISTALLNLSETGELQRIHNKWLGISKCNSHINQDGPNKLRLTSFWGIFLVSGVAAMAALLVFVYRLALQFRHHPRSSDDSLHSGSVLRNFASFVDQKEIDRKSEGSSKRRRTEEEGEINQTTRE
ncbi:glutamate receptor 3.4 isoform X2 [Cryptomeria japonica]|uniref:glutamate receptor 3.4 isoform X2 n=1 Tax=Cryptomeria japonica TaxID=3369 RepID=UPI0027DA3369|nr:glutamate receptor 3.4 isoform X2 [Cryptomeria japonica]